MRRWIVIVALLAAGSGCPSQPAAGPPPTAPTTQALGSQLQDFEAENQRLKAEINILQQDKDYLLRREEKLSAETRYVKFLNDQQARQLAALADAPGDRDYYHKLAEKLAAEREQLLGQIQELRRQLGMTPLPATASTPASAPATASAPADI
jgi:cell division protein FtsB